MEFKFRAWDREAGRMFAHSFIQEYSLEEILEAYGEGDAGTLMQFIGLKDTNDRDIYLHDIVKLTFEDEDHNVMATETDVVVFEDIGAFAFAPSLKHRGLTVRDFWHRYKGARYIKYEVLGNIYENPQLLEASQVTPKAEEAGQC